MNSTKLGIEYLPKPFWKTTSTDIISIKERRIGVIDGQLAGDCSITLMNIKILQVKTMNIQRILILL